MKITYHEFKNAMKAADAVMVDGNIMFHDVQCDGRVNFFWDDSDGLEYRYYASGETSFNPDTGEDEPELTIELGRDGSFVLNGLYSDADDEFNRSTSVVKMLMFTPYKPKKGKK